MQDRRKIGLIFVAAASGIVTAVFGIFALLNDEAPSSSLFTLALISAVSGTGAVWLLWLAVDHLLLKAAAGLEGEARMLGHGTSAGKIPEDRYGALAPVAQAINELAEKLAAARDDRDLAVAASTARVEEQKGRLAAVLNDLHDGVLVCNLKHQVLLYNQAALRLLHLSGDLGIGRDLLGILTGEPVLHTLERLTLRYADGRHRDHPRGVSADFVTATTDGRYLLQGTLSLLIQESALAGYVLTVSDVTSTLATLGRRDALLRAATEDFRGPVANLRAAAETLHDCGDLPDEARRALEEVLIGQSLVLSERLEALTHDHRSLVAGAWPKSDIHSGNLINLVAARSRASHGPAVTPTGLPQWIHGDSYGLVLTIAQLLKRLSQQLGATAFDLSVEPAGDWVHLDAAWTGMPAAASEIEKWAGERLADALGGLTVGDVLRHHGSEAWSEPAGPGRARLRIPLPPATEPHGRTGNDVPPPRPEFFDFALLHQPLATSELGRTRLKDLPYVVFDTETTGLQPSQGDEILSIAGVRIVNGRLLTGETFNQLVNPGRGIPAESTRFHGITEAMVRDRPRATAVLPQFHAFVSGSVLVAHNAAFDLKFLKMKEQAIGKRFDNPVLDTMLLSRRLQGDAAEHGLDAIAQRLGIRVVDRHTALGDALLTAAIFLRFLDMLEERGISTLDDAIRAANIQVELQARERVF